MSIKSRLRNSLVRKIQHLSTDKLAEVNTLLAKIQDQVKSREKTLGLAGSWRDLENDLIIDLTDHLHSNRAKDRHSDLL